MRISFAKIVSFERRKLKRIFEKRKSWSINDVKKDWCSIKRNLKKKAVQSMILICLSFKIKKSNQKCINTLSIKDLKNSSEQEVCNLGISRNWWQYERNEKKSKKRKKVNEIRLCKEKVNNWNAKFEMNAEFLRQKNTELNKVI